MGDQLKMTTGAMLSSMDTTEMSEDLETAWPIALQICVPIACVIVFAIVIYILHIIDDPGLKEEKYSKVTEAEAGDLLPKTNHKGSIGSTPDSQTPQENTQKQTREQRRTLSDSSSGIGDIGERKRLYSTGSETQVMLEGFLKRSRPSLDNSSGTGGLGFLVRPHFGGKAGRTRSKSTSEAVPLSAKRKLLARSKNAGDAEEIGRVPGIGMIEEESCGDESTANIEKNRATIS